MIRKIVFVAVLLGLTVWWLRKPAPVMITSNTALATYRAVVTNNLPATALPTSSNPSTSPAFSGKLPSAAYTTPPLGERAWHQIQILRELKAKWTPAQKKLDSQLLYAEKLSHGEKIAPDLSKVRYNLDTDRLNRVAVEMRAHVTAFLLWQLRLAGAEIINSFPAYNSVRAWVPLTRLEQIAALPAVLFVEPAPQPTFHAGSVVTEGDVTHGAAHVRAAYGADGSGVKIGVLSDSIRYLSHSLGAHELDSVTVLPGQEGLDLPASPPDEGEGTAMLEIVHDLAPKAQLFFATATGGTASFATNILKLRSAGCDIIVDDVSYGNESPFQDGPIAQAVNAVTADGALYFSSAGNSGNAADGTSGTWEGDFLPAGNDLDVPKFGTIHDFGGGRLFNTVTNGGNNRSLGLFWSDPLGAATSDYDVYLLDTEGNVVDFSLRTQDGTQDPYENIPKLANGDRIIVMLSFGEPRFLHLSVQARLAISTSGSVAGHACATNAFCVAAVRALSSYPEAFAGGVKNSVENFSSDGPRRIFFTPSGDPLTPGDFSSSGGKVLQKPDIAAADGVSTSVPAESNGRLIFNPFFGTSAAAPHAAAITALLKSGNPSLGSAELRAALASTALDIESLGVDGDSGFGLIMADAAFLKILQTNWPSITGISPPQGTPGASVTIVGTNLSSVQSVQFGGLDAVFTLQSDNSLTATIPANAVTGYIEIRNASGAARSVTPFIISGLPIITSFSPAFGKTGQTVTVRGTNFNGVTDVMFDGHSASSFNVISPSLLTAISPPGADSGPVTVTTTSGVATSATAFIIPLPPSITDFSPAKGHIGQSVGIGGNNLDSVTGVVVGGVLTTNISIDDPTVIWVRVPTGAITGRITVISPGGTAMSTNVFTVVTPPSNDNFVNSVVLTGVSGSVSGDTTAASKEEDEPFHAGNPGGKSVWYQWAAPTTGEWTFDTRGRSFDTLIGVYTGTSVTNLTYIGSDDDADGNVWSRATFHAAAGTIYHIAVDGSWFGFDPSDLADSGTFVLEWKPATPASVITSISPLLGAVGTPITVTGQNLGGTFAARMSGLRASFILNSPTRLTVIVPQGATNSPVILVLPSGGISSDDIFAVGPGVANDNFTNAIPISGADGKIFGNNSAASTEPNEPAPVKNASGKSVWFEWVAPSGGNWKFDTKGSSIDTALAIFTGAQLGKLIVVSSNDDSDDELTSSLVFHAVAQQSYYILLDGAANDSGNFVLNWHAAPPPLVSGFLPGSGLPGSTVIVSGQNFSGITGVRFGRIGSSAFTVDSETQIRAVVPVNAESGQIRLLAGDQSGISSGNFTVLGTRPPNDDVENAQLITGKAAILVGSNLGATKQAQEQINGGNGNSVWYRWVAPTNGNWTIDTSDSDFKPVLAVSDSTISVPNLTISDNDPYEAHWTFQAIAGHSYSIAVDSATGVTGGFVLKLAPAPPSSVIYETHFENSEGFIGQRALQGQKGWGSTGTSGNGVVPGLFSSGGQQAYIGYGAPLAAGRSIEVWRPLGYTPPAQSVVRFTVLMQVTPSSTSAYDRFSWRIHNQAGVSLFSVSFNNATREAGFSLDDNAGFRSSGISFNNYTPYHLQITMDFQNNRWSAFLGSLPLALAQPITTTGATLDLDRIAAQWESQPTSASGDNFMIFDDFRVTAETSQLPRILVPPQNIAVVPGSDAVLSVTATGGEPLQYQWKQNGTDVPGATNAVLLFRNIASAEAGTYAVTVSGPFGSVTSDISQVTLGEVGVLKLSVSPQDPRSGFHIQLSTSAGVTYEIEGSTNLQQWIPIGTLSGPSKIFFDPSASTQRFKFYRAKSL